jgi:imidazolonepropionase-like amidohydrolase
MWDGWERGSFTADWKDEDYAAGQDAYPRLVRLIRTLFDNGVPLVVGTDTPTPWTIPGVSFHQELALLKETGVSNADVLRMATINGARALGLDKEVGRVALGYQADIVVLRANPLDDLANARSIERVVNDGRVLEPSVLKR